MFKKIAQTFIILIIVLIFNNYNYAFAQTCQWAEKIAGTEEDQGNVIATDSSGNVYVAGSFSSSTLTLNNGMYLTHSGGTDAFLAKYNENGVCQWVEKIAGSNQDNIKKITLDKEGCIYVAGNFGSNTLTFNNGKTLSNSTSADDAFIAKYNNDGICEWAEKIASYSSDYANSIVVDSIGNVYVAGYYSGNCTFNNGISLLYFGMFDGFLAKYNSNGLCQWARRIVGSSYENINSLGIDSNGNLYIIGNYNSNQIYLGEQKTLYKNGNYQDVFLSKFDNSGTCLWAERISGTNGEEGVDLIIDSNNDIYVTGTFYSETLNFNNNISLLNSGNNDIFLSKYNEDGICQWAVKIAGSSNEKVSSISIDKNNNLFLSGNFYSSTLTTNNNITLENIGDSDGFFTKFSNGGVCKWIEKIASSNYETCTNITIDDSDNVLILGNFSTPSLSFNDSISLSNVGNSDIFIAKYNATILASINTRSVSEISGNSAKCGGNIINDGGGTISARGVCWSTNPSPTINDSKTTDGTGMGEFVSNITGLSPYTTYYVRAYVTNTKGTSYGEQIRFAFKKKIFVKYDASGLNDGTSWENAFTSLQTGLSYAEENSEIWVARGTYKPTVKVNGNTNRHKTFLMKKRISLIGGFAGTESSPSQRNIDNNPTILSGDIGTVGDSIDNCFHIVTYQVEDEFFDDDVLDGFIIKYGNSNSENPDNRGAAIILNQNGNPSIQNCLLENNYTTFRGGAVYNAETAVNFKNCKFTNNQSTTEGGAIFNYYAHLTNFTNCEFSYNKSESGGAIYNYYTDSLEIDSCEVSFNVANESGGGINSYYSNNSFNVSTFNNNSSNSGVGGGLASIASFNIFNYCLINNNSSNYVNGGGGGVSTSLCSNFYINSTISENKAAFMGGGIKSSDSENLFINTKIINNESHTGGGIGSNYDTKNILNNCIIKNNKTIGTYNESGGGGIYSQYSSIFIFSSSILSDNISGNDGGALKIDNGCYFYNCLINNNSAVNNGGAIYGRFNFNNSTISNNEAKKGAGVYLTYDISSLKNTILWGNTASVDGNEIYKESGTLTLDNSCFANGNGDIFGTISANNCINTDPIFVDPNDNDFRVYGVSPCVDAGNDDYLEDDYDIRGVGYGRYLDGTDSTLLGTVDMGAYEYKHGVDKLQPPALTTPVLLHPQNNDNEVGKVAEFKWRKVQNATGYRIQVSNTNTFAIKFINQVESDTVVTIEDLNPFMTQYWRVAALNQTDSLWSAVWTFTTNDIDQAAVTTNSITEIGAYSAKGGGNVTDDGDGIVIARGVCWNKTGNPTVANSKTIDSSGLGEFVSAITDLEKNTTYYVRAYATNIAGTVYGSQISFKTSSTVVPPSSWSHRSETGNNSSVILLKSVNPKVGDRNFQKGDALGAFYTRNGVLVCAGYGIWNDENLAITVWGDDDQTTLKDGFELEENYTFKIWDAQFGKELFGEFTIDTGYAYYTVNGISYLSSLKNVDIITQGFYIKNGWNLISSYLIPENDSLEVVYRNIENKLVIAKNGSGLVYIPSYGINSIGNWKYKEGYQVYMSSGDTLKITGMEVKPQNEKIILNNGWSLVSYLRNTSKPITESLTSLTESGSLTIAKNTSGQVYIPSYEINSIGNMLPGQGYQMYLSKKDTLVYPANGAGRAYSNSLTPMAKYILPEYTETGNSAVLLLEIEGQNGDEIAVYNQNNQVIGSGVIHKNKAAVTIWGDNERTSEIDGAILSEKLKVKSYNVNSGRIIDVNLWDLVDVVTGNNIYELNYSKDAFFVAKAKVLDNNSNISMQVNPNPASDYIEITIEGETDNTSLILFSNEGKQIADLTSELLTLSGNKLRYNTTNLTSGTYNLILNNGADKIIKQIMIVK